VEMPGGIATSPSLPNVESGVAGLEMTPEATSAPEPFLPPDAQEEEEGLGLLPLFGGLAGLAAVGGMVAWVVARRRRPTAGGIAASPSRKAMMPPPPPYVPPKQEPRPHMVTCPKCGTPNEPSHRFCLKCGTRLS
jgi:hypothetical protein